MKQRRLILVAVFVIGGLLLMGNFCGPALLYFIGITLEQVNLDTTMAGTGQRIPAAKAYVDEVRTFISSVSEDELLLVDEARPLGVYEWNPSCVEAIISYQYSTQDSLDDVVGRYSYALTHAGWSHANRNSNQDYHLFRAPDPQLGEVRVKVEVTDVDSETQPTMRERPTLYEVDLWFVEPAFSHCIG